MTFTAEDIVLFTAERLLDAEKVTQALPTGAGTSLSDGLAGTAILHARLAAIDKSFATAAVHHWTAAMTQLRASPHPSHGIQNGRGGLAASLLIGNQYLPDPECLHRATYESIRWLSKYVERACVEFEHQPRDGGPSWHVYDAITGLTGTGRVLLTATQAEHDRAQQGLFEALVMLTDLLRPRHDGRPGWWLAARHHPSATHVHPSGAATTGIAHGIAGPLAFLATAHIQGWSVPGQTEAIEYAADWLVRWRKPNATWPPAVTGDEVDDDTAAPSATGRADAWCYGTPGITRALTLAGHTLGVPRLNTVAQHALSAMAQRPPCQWDTEGSTMCHGMAGVMQSTLHTNPQIADAAAGHIIESFDPHTSFGFRRHEGHRAYDDPGLFNGATGTVLALADYAKLPTLITSKWGHWDSLFNLS